MITTGSVVKVRRDDSDRIATVLWIQERGGRQLACLQSRSGVECTPLGACELLFLNCFGQFYDSNGNLVSNAVVQEALDA